MLTLEQISQISAESKKKAIWDLYGQSCELFCRNLVYTLDEHDTTGQPIKKLPDWPYIYELLEDYQRYHWIYVLKSRQVMVTWVTLAYLLWLALFHKGRRIAVQSKKDHDANALIERMKIIYDHLPSWKPHAEFVFNKMRVPEQHSVVMGVPQGPSQLRSYTFSTIFSDEFGFQTELEESFAASKPTVDGGGQFIAVTTPPQQRNFAYNLLKNELFTEPHKGKLIKIHYSARPDRGPEWVKSAKVGYTESAWNREQELMFVEEGARRVYDPFNARIHVNPNIVYNPELPIYRAWDFGFHRPACLVSQVDGDDILYDLREWLGRDEVLEDFAMRVIRIQNQLFPEARYVDFCDIAGKQVNDLSKKNAISVLRDIIGHIPYARKLSVEEGHDMIRKKMTTLIRGKPAYQIHPSCTNSIEGFEYGYVYKKDWKTACGDGINEDGEKEKEYYTHLQDCRRFIVQNLWTPMGNKLNTNLKRSALK